MNELQALKERLNKVSFICQLCERDRQTVEHLARFEASILELDFDIDCMNERNWFALHLIDRIENMFTEG